MYQHVGTEDGLVVDDDFACQLCAVADDDIVADDNVVCHVHAFHQQVVAAHDGAAFGFGATIDGYVFAYLVVVTDFGGGFLTHKLQVLGYGTDDGPREEDVPVADA